jgi:Ca-activated chloride channel family protein
MKAHAALLAALLFLPAVSAAQEATFRVSVDLVRVDVLPTDQGVPMRGLRADDFVLTDNGQRQVIESVSTETEGIDIILAFDVSESVHGPTLSHLKDAAKAVLDSLQPRDRAQLITFSHRVEIQTPMTSELPVVKRALDALEASGSTSVMDALYTALALREVGERRSMVLLFSDGYDNRSWLAPQQVLRVVRETDTVIYAVAFRAPDDMLTEVTRAAGGRLVSGKDAASLRALFLELLREMRSRYVLAYYPRGVERSGWHQIEVRLKSGKGRISARPGYLR